MWITRTHDRAIANLATLADRLRKHGGKVVQYESVFSMIAISERKKHFVWMPKERSAVARGLPYTVMTAIFGWWSLGGLFWSCEVLAENLGGGTDVTEEIRQATEGLSIQEIEDSIPKSRRNESRNALIAFAAIVGVIVMIVYFSI